MTIWILALVLVASTVGLGYRQGVIRAACSLVGIVFATLLAAPLGRLIQPVLLHVGLPNPTLASLVAPIVAFPVVLILSKVAGGWLHHKSEMHSKHRTSELEHSIWTRLNHRLGACVGVINGTAYLVLITFVIFNFSYWTYQAAGSENEPFTTRMINHLGEDAQSTGLARTAPAVGTLPDNYYRLADLAGLICQNPRVSARIARYPAFLSLLERGDIQQLANDNEFTNAWATQAPMSQILNVPAMQSVLHNNDLLNTVWAVVEPNMDDLTTYLKTGKSPKYDSQPLLGHWDFDARVTFAYALLAQPKITTADAAAARAWMVRAYANTMMVVAADNQAYMKFWPDTKATAQPGQPQPTVNWNGQWSQSGTNYQFTLSDRTFNAVLMDDGQRLLLKDRQDTFAFDHAE